MEEQKTKEVKINDDSDKEKKEKVKKEKKSILKKDDKPEKLERPSSRESKSTVMTSKRLNTLG